MRYLDLTWSALGSGFSHAVDLPRVPVHYVPLVFVGGLVVTGRVAIWTDRPGVQLAPPGRQRCNRAARIAGTGHHE
jgi:hypothetical protein